MSGMSSPDPVERAARLLALVLERAPRTEQDLRAQLDLVEPELAPLVDALERHGLVQRDHGRLRPGPTAMRFARTEVARGELVEHARASLRRLAEESGETVNLMVPTPGGTEAIGQEDGRHLLGTTSWIGRVVRDRARGAGEALLACGAAAIAPRPERGRRRRGDLHRVAPTQQRAAQAADAAQPGVGAVAQLAARAVGVLEDRLREVAAEEAHVVESRALQVELAQVAALEGHALQARVVQRGQVHPALTHDHVAQQ